MTTTLILIIINTLLIMGLNSSLSLKTTQYKDNIILDKTETLIKQEKIITEAADAFCRKNIDICFDELKSQNIRNFTSAELSNFVPSGINIEKMNDLFYQNIGMDYTNKTIIITHEINNLSNREKYFGNRLNKYKDIACFENQTKPCVSNIIFKKEKMSEELKIKILEKEISLLNQKLLIAETYVGEHQAYINQIALYQTDIDFLTTEKGKRKLTNFKGE